MISLLLRKIADRSILCQNDIAVICRKFSDDNSQKGGFSGAVYAHKSSTFVFIDMKRNVGKERFVIKLFFYMVTS